MDRMTPVTNADIDIDNIRLPDNFDHIVDKIQHKSKDRRTQESKVLNTRHNELWNQRPSRKFKYNKKGNQRKWQPSKKT